MNRFTRTQWGLIMAVVALLLAALTLLLARFLPDGVDWHLTFRPAALKLLNGQTPYGIIAAEQEFAGAPWALIPLLPLALLPASIGRAVLFIIGLMAFAAAAYRLGASALSMGAFVASPPVIHCLLNANIDWMPVLGFTLSPWLGLFFIAAKPQVGFVVALFWLVESWRGGGIAQVVRVFAPVTVALLLSFALFGLWPLGGLSIMEHSRGWNASLWPLSIPVGLALTVAALRRRDKRYAMGASPCLSPYVLFHAWSGALAALAANTPKMVAAVAGLWLLVALVGLS